MKMISHNFSKVLGVFVLAVSLAVVSTPCLSAQQDLMTRLQGHIPQKAIAHAMWIGGLPFQTHISLAFSLPLRNQQELNDLLKQLYDPNDPHYGQYLTPQEFADKFGPTQDDYDAVINYAKSLGFTITKTYSNRTLLDVSGSAAMVDAAFGLSLQQYQASNGRKFYAPDRNPLVPDSIASRIVGIFGLDNAAVWHTHSQFISAANFSKISPNQIGSGPGGGLTPNDIRTAYNLSSVFTSAPANQLPGSGQTLGLFELAGYKASDVTHYVSYYGLPSVPLQNFLVDGASGGAGSGADEVTLDIELQIALAPGASKIIVYEGLNSSTGVLDTYSRIATDNLAKQISTSWGLSEVQSSTAFLKSENTIFVQMAAQGQSIYAAAGDEGAYDSGSKRTLSVDDPASQPYMVGVGGTQLYVNSDGTYNYETTWNVNNRINGGAGGGGVSAVWSIPSWQEGITSAASSAMRNVPDVSLNSDQYTGYSIYYNGSWYIYGGTSCAAPLWAAFTALVNQDRADNGATALGFANPAIYGIAESGDYGTDFNDITQGTNLYYSAGPGYDNATGWGSFNGANLLAALTDGSSSTPTASIPDTPTGLMAVSGNKKVTLSWLTSPRATSYNIYRSVNTRGGEGNTPYVSGISGTNYTDSGLTNGTTYYYEVSATNSAGESSPTSEVSATPTGHGGSGGNTGHGPHK